MNQMLNQSQKDSLSDGNRKRPIWSFVLHYLLFKFFGGAGQPAPLFFSKQKTTRVVHV